jgi:hypothetical protein
VAYGLAPAAGNPIDGWQLIAPAGVRMISTYAPPGYTCTDTASDVIECLGGPPLSSPFTGTLTISAPTVTGLLVAGTTDGGASWWIPNPLTPLG